MSKLIKSDSEYAKWILSVCNEFKQSQIKAALKINSEMLGFYWHLGSQIAEKKKSAKYGDNQTIGLLICKSKDNVLAKYALESSSEPLGISEYEISKLFPTGFKGTLPSIEEIEANLQN